MASTTDPTHNLTKLNNALKSTPLLKEHFCQLLRFLPSSMNWRSLEELSLKKPSEPSFILEGLLHQAQRKAKSFYTSNSTLRLSGYSRKTTEISFNSIFIASFNQRTKFHTFSDIFLRGKMFCWVWLSSIVMSDIHLNHTMIGVCSILSVLERAY